MVGASFKNPKKKGERKNSISIIDRQKSGSSRVRLSDLYSIHGRFTFSYPDVASFLTMIEEEKNNPLNLYSKVSLTALYSSSKPFLSSQDTVYKDTINMMCEWKSVVVVVGKGKKKKKTT